MNPRLVRGLLCSALRLEEWLSVADVAERLSKVALSSRLLPNMERGGFKSMGKTLQSFSTHWSYFYLLWHSFKQG
jgi:hypothetical protein